MKSAGLVPEFLRGGSARGWLGLFLLIAALWLPVGFWGADANFIPCNKDCGETYVALHQAKNFAAFGFDYGLLEDGATSSDPAAHPALYTHNMNIGSLYYTAIEAVIGGSYKIKQLATYMIYLVALIYGVIAVWRISGSRGLAALFLLFFATDFEQVISFSFNGLRGWAWLPLFGVSAHFVPLCRGQSRYPLWDWAFVLIFALISFGIGYEFLAINFSIAFFVLIVFSPSGTLISRGTFKRLFLLVGAFAVPVVLRQIQVMMVLGVEYWAKDLYTSAAIKVPYLSKILPIPPMEEIDAYYRSLNVIRPPSMPSSSLGEIFDFAVSTLKYLTLPANGVVTLAIFALTACISMVIVIRRSRRKTEDAGEHVGERDGEKWLLALLIGAAFGLLIFMPLSLHVYLKHQFPLVAVPIYLAKALFVFWLIKLALKAGQRGYVRMAAFLVVGLLAIDHAVVHKTNFERAQSLPSGWVKAVRNSGNASFAVSWIPNLAAPFTDNWAVGVQPGKERAVAKRLASGEPPFAYSDYFVFYQKDADETRGNYLHPDFWIYFPVDNVFRFDTPNPECRGDYLTALVTAGEKPVASNPWVYRSANSLNLGTRIDLDPEAVQSVEVLEPFITTEWMTGDQIMETFKPALDRPAMAKMSYNCRYKAAAANFDLKPEWFPKTPTFRHYPIRVTYKNGERFIVQVVATQMQRAEPYRDAKPASVGVTQPTPEALSQLMPAVPVYDQGEAYAIFDLRGLAASKAPVKDVSEAAGGGPLQRFLWAERSASGVELTWSNGEPETTVEIEMDQGGAFAVVGKAQPGQTVYHIGGLAETSAYSFRVRSCVDGNCTPSNAVTVAPLP